MVEKSRREVDEQIRETGEQTTFDIGIHNLHPDLMKILGRLRYPYKLWSKRLKALNRSGISWQDFWLLN